MPLALLLAIASPTAQTEAVAWLAQVKPGAKRYFYDEGKPGCPALIAKCRRAGFVVAGDQLIATTQKGSFTYVTYVNRAGTESSGWIESAGLIRVTPPPVTAASWVGNWQRTEASIEIAPARRRGWYAVSGTATWGAWDPDRVARGAINMGELDGQIALTNGRITGFSGDIVRSLPAEDPGDYVCRTSLALFGPYLLVEDNGQCGGVNVSFSGTYRK